MRDYDTPPPTGTIEVHPYGERIWEGNRYEIRQIWTWHGPRYEVALEIVPTEGLETTETTTLVRTSYLAIPPSRVMELLREAGFERVERVDGRFFQPVLVAHLT